MSKLGVVKPADAIPVNFFYTWLSMYDIGERVELIVGAGSTPLLLNAVLGTCYPSLPF